MNIKIRYVVSYIIGAAFTAVLMIYMLNRYFNL